MNLIKKYKSLTLDQKQLTKIFSVVVILVIFIWCGYNETHAKVTNCNVKTTAYVRAYFEEDYNTICSDIDEDGDLETYSCVKTNYWDKAASPIWSVSSSNGGTAVSNAPTDEVYLTTSDFYTTRVPDVDDNMTDQYTTKDERYFERFSETYSIKHIVNIINDDGTSDYITKPNSFYPQCNAFKEQQNSIKVKNWYMFSYNIEGFEG